MLFKSNDGRSPSNCTVSCLMIVDATDAVLGRLATFVAKKLLNGERVDVINSEKAVITGNPKLTVEKYLKRIKRGSPQHGPFFPRKPNMVVSRAIRGMLPYEKSKGRNAFKNLRVYFGLPEEFKNKEVAKLPAKDIKCKFITVYDLCKKLGWNNKLQTD